MALDTNISAEDQMAITPTQKGDLESDTGPLSMQQQRKQAARNIMSMQGIPKRCKGGGDYFFEMQDGGGIKITGGDSATNLTGGKSVTITDRASISDILEKARGGDILEEGAIYTVKEEVEPQPQRRLSREEMATIPQRHDFGDDMTGGSTGSPDFFGESDSVASEEERIGQSGANVRASDMGRGVDLMEERESEAPAENPLLAKLKEARTGLLDMIEKAENEQLASAYRSALEQVEKGLQKELQYR